MSDVPEPDHRLGGSRAWVIWCTAVAIYVLAIFHRTSLGVAGIAAAHRFGISSSQLATFAMVQLAVYAAMQVPVGALLDRFGSKVMLGAGLLTMSLGQLAFAFAESFQAGIGARVLVGAGDAMVFTSVLRLVALWFPPARTPMVTQLTGMVGQLGALIAAGPLAVGLSGLGWTTTFLVAAAAGGVLAVLLVLVVIDSPYAEHDRTELKMRALGRALRMAWREPGTKLGMWCHFTSQFSANTFTVMWGFPFLTAGEGLSTGTASTLLALMVVTTVCASPVFGALVTRYPYSRSTLVLGLVATIVTMWTAVLAWPGRAPLWLLVLMVVLTAIGGPGSMVGFDLARSFNPAHRLGSATGIVNVGGFVASLATVLLVGIVLDRLAPGGPSTYSVDSFRGAMAVQYLGWALGVGMILRYRRRTRRLVHAATDGEFDHLLPRRAVR